MDKMIKRMKQLEDNAIYLYLDKTDFDRIEWMSEEDKKEYLYIYKKVNGECFECGESNCNH